MYPKTHQKKTHVTSMIKKENVTISTIAPDVLDKSPSRFKSTIGISLIRSTVSHLMGALLLPVFIWMALDGYINPIPFVGGFLLAIALIYIWEIRSLPKTLKLVFVDLIVFITKTFFQFISDCFLSVIYAKRILFSSLSAPPFEIDVEKCRTANEFFEGENNLVRIAHLSDLHLTRNNLFPMCEGGKSPNEIFDKILTNNIDTLRRCDFIVFTGDITDSGRTEEWNSFLRSIRPVFDGDTRPNLIICPGNHDINITDGRLKSLSEMDFSPGRRIRIMRFFRVLAELSNITAYKTYQSELQSELQHRSEALHWILNASDSSDKAKAQLNSGWTAAINNIEQIEADCFPLFGIAGNNTTDGLIGYAIFDSVMPFGNILGNALGRISSKQLSNFKSHGVRWINKDNRINMIFMHHHLVRTASARTIGFGSFLYRRFIQPSLMILLNGKTVNKIIGEIPRLIVFHGHKHVYSRHLTPEGTTVISAPSTTLGCENSNMPAGLFVLAVKPEGNKVAVVKELFCSA